MGLLALMLLVESRRATRSTADGDLVLLADQDRSLWDRALIDEGQAMVRECLRRNEPGPYQIQAATNAVHADALSSADTDGWQILALYDQLLVVPRAFSWRSTGRSRWPRCRDRLRRSPSWMASISTATTSCTPSGPICSSGWAV